MEYSKVLETKNQVESIVKKCGLTRQGRWEKTSHNGGYM